MGPEYDHPKSYQHGQRPELSYSNDMSILYQCIITVMWPRIDSENYVTDCPEFSQ